MEKSPLLIWGHQLRKNYKLNTVIGKYLNTIIGKISTVI